MKKLILLLAITFGLCYSSTAQNIDVELKGVYKEINVEENNKTIEILNGNDKKLKEKTVEKIKQNPNNFNPPVLYALSRELFNQDKKDEAMYWFYLAQIRARYDANLCLDNSAKQAVSIYNNGYGPDINNYAFKDLVKLEKVVTQVVEFVRNNKENYDQRWINLHGMDAIMTGMGNGSENPQLSHDKDKWADIKKKTVDDYYNGFITYVKNQKN